MRILVSSRCTIRRARAAACRDARLRRRETRYKKQHSGALAPSRSVFGLLGTRRVDLLNCLDDEAATERASLLAKEHPVEVWDGNRCRACGGILRWRTGYQRLRSRGRNSPFLGFNKTSLEPDRGFDPKTLMASSIKGWSSGSSLLAASTISRPNLDLRASLVLPRSWIWPAPGSEDTELRCLMEQEAGHGEATVYAGVQG
jgi:hypothetical protein